MAPEDALLGTIDRLYAAAREPEEWSAALDAVTELLGAGHTILMAGGKTEPGFALGARVDQQAVEALVSVQPGELRDHLDLGSLPDGRLVRRNRLIEDADFLRMEYYNEIVRPLGGFHSFFYRRALAPGGCLAVAICRPPDAEDFDAKDEALLTALLPHLDNAIDLHLRMQAAEQQNARLVQVIEGLRAAVILTDWRGQVLHCNRAAYRLLAEADGLAIGPSGLLAASTAATRRLRRAIASAAQPPDTYGRLALSGLERHRASSPSRPRLSLKRPSFRPPLTVDVLPIRAFDAAAGGGLGGVPAAPGEPSVALFVEPSDTEITLDAATIGEAFGLTRREAEIAALIGMGHNLSTISSRLGIGAGTARNHLKRAFDKTGARSQAALVALLRGFAGSLA